MNDKTDPNENGLVRSINRSLAIKRSGLVKRGLEMIDKAKKRQVRVLIGELQESTVDFFSELLKTGTKDKYDLKINWALYGEDLLELAENAAFDIFIVTLNNIRFQSDYPFQGPLEKTLQLISQIKRTYKIPVIALSSQPKELAMAESVADFLLPRPFELNPFMEAIEKCLDMRPKFDEIQRKSPIKGDG